MRLIILNQFFYPDHSATSQLMTDLAASLVESEVEVTALAGRGRYNGGERLAARETHLGVHIERAWSTGFGKRSAAGRIADYLSFYLGASWRLLKLPRHDIILALTTPPLIGLIALIIGRLRGMRVVALVQDLYPDVAVALGALGRRSLATRALDYLSRFMLRRSDRIIVLGECMRERVLDKIGLESTERVVVIHNWADSLEIKPLEGEENSFAAAEQLAGKFVLLFSGNLGRVNEFGTVLDAALALRDREEILFLFVGEGAKSVEIESFATAHALSNIRLLPYQPREMLRHSLSAGHASLVTLADGLAGLSVPSKTYGILAAGRPIIFVGDPFSSVARIVDEHCCGAVVRTGESARLAQIISDWADEPEKLAPLNRAARETFLKYFDRSMAVKYYLETFQECLRDSHVPAAVSKLEETSP